MSFTSRWRDVYLATGCRAVSSCGDFMAATALTLTLQERGAGSGAVAAVLIAAVIPPVVLARWTGRIADRMDSRRLLVVAGLVQAVVCLLLAHVSGIVAVVALVAALGTGLAITQPVLAALLPAMVRAEDLGRAAALGQTANSVGVLVAPVIGGVLTGEFGLRVPLYVDAASYLAIAAAGLLIRTRRGGRARPVELGGGAGPVVRADPLLWSTFVLIGVVVAAVCAVNVGEVFLVRDVLDGSATVYGLLSGTWTAGMMLGAWLLTRWRLDDGRLATTLLVMLGLTSAVVVVWGMVPALGWLVPLFVLGGATNGAENVAAGLLIARRVPAELHGSAFALYGAVANAAQLVGLLTGGALLAALPVRLVISGAGVLALLACAALAVPVLRAAGQELAERRATQATA